MFDLHPLIILGIAVATVVGMIIVLRINAFIALITAAIVVSLLAPGESSEKISRVAVAFGNTAGKIGIVIAMAAVIGRCLIDSGSAEEIYIRATYKAAEMMQCIISEEIAPVPQQGKVAVFERRRPEESEITEVESLQQLYDFIRMLDAEGYPHAFIKWQGFRLEFSRATPYNGQVMADVQIVKAKEGES